MPRSAKWGRLVRRFSPVFGTLEYAAGTMDAGWPPNAGGARAWTSEIRRTGARPPHYPLCDARRDTTPHQITLIGDEPGQRVSSIVGYLC